MRPRETLAQRRCRGASIRTLGSSYSGTSVPRAVQYLASIDKLAHVIDVRRSSLVRTGGDACTSTTSPPA